MAIRCWPGAMSNAPCWRARPSSHCRPSPCWRRWGEALGQAGEDLTPERIALHTASHSGWPETVDPIRAWLAEMGHDETVLACGSGEGPLDPQAALSLAREGGVSGRAHHNCAGQHTGFVRLAHALGVDPVGYEQPDHPVQRAVAAVLDSMTDIETATAPAGVEGCGIPSLALPLWAVALGMARLADPSGLPGPRRRAAQRLVAAMAAHPTLVGGPGRGDTRIMQTTGGRVLAKEGADGNIVAMVPGRGLGVAIKIDDGARRGAHVALGLVLETLGVLDPSEREALADVFQPVLTNAAGDPVGRVFPVCPEESDDSKEEDEEDGPRTDPWDEGWD